MGFMRGLSPAYMDGTPAINDWVHEIVTADHTLRRCGFTVLRERAAIGYTGDAYHRLDASSPYQKMLAALWRECPVHRLEPGEQLATMAALLHRDAAGRLVRRRPWSTRPAGPRSSGCSCLPARPSAAAGALPAGHDLAFMAHGENLIMVLRDGLPMRMLMKDIGEEVAVLGSQPLPSLPSVSGTSSAEDSCRSRS